MTELLLDPDVFLPDDPEEMQPDHDESLNPHLVPEDQPEGFPEMWESPFKESALWLPPQRVTNGPDVKMSREIHEGMEGDDVVGHKRALSRARPDLYIWDPPFTPLAGKFFMDAVVIDKKQHGFGTTRVLGGRYHEHLEDRRRKGYPTEWAFDALAIADCQRYWDAHHIDPETRIRNAMVAAGFFWFAHKWDIAYSQYRAFQVGKPNFVPSRWDCSAFVTNCFYAGGAPNPNGRPWDGLGYTGTLMGRGVRVGSVTNLKPGDLIFYGSSVAKPGFNAGDPTHVAMYVGKRDGNHMILTMGSYPMKYVVYSYRHDINHFRHYDVYGL